jgi:hypothetical protein
MQRVGVRRTIDDCLQEDGVQRDLEDALRALLEELRAAPEKAAVRRLVRSDLDVEAEGTTFRSLWLLVHRGLRRAGLRAHPESGALLVAWRGEGIVQLRPPGGRRSVTLATRAASADDPVAPHVLVPAGTPYDTLADAGRWDVVAFHTHPGPGLRRQQWKTGLDGESCVEEPEEDPS